MGPLIGGSTMVKIEEVLGKLENVVEYGEQFTARCPAHDDRQNSLAITTGQNGRTLFHCFAGCDYEDIISALGYKASDFKGNKSKDNKKIVKTYDYVNLQGTLLYQVVRTDPKGFFQRRPNGNKGWEKGLGNVNRVLYNLPGIINAVSNNQQILFVEGEKDADNLINLGFVATTSAMGAGSWKDSYAQCLDGADVVIIPDNDTAGQKYANMVAESIIKYGGTVKILNLPNLPEKADVSDWLNNGGTKENLIELLNSAPIYKAQAQSPNDNPISPRVLPLTDLGNAERLVSKFGQDIRYCHEAKQWLI